MLILSNDTFASSSLLLLLCLLSRVCNCELFQRDSSRDLDCLIALFIDDSMASISRSGLCNTEQTIDRLP